MHYHCCLRICLSSRVKLQPGATAGPLRHLSIYKVFTLWLSWALRNTRSLREFTDSDDYLFSVYPFVTAMVTSEEVLDAFNGKLCFEKAFEYNLDVFLFSIPDILTTLPNG